VNAAASLVRDTLHGRFKACAQQPSRDEMLGFMKASAGKSDYLGNFLIEDLTQELQHTGG
jgi:hypothetical protein